MFTLKLTQVSVHYLEIFLQGFLTLQGSHSEWLDNNKQTTVAEKKISKGQIFSDGKRMITEQTKCCSFGEESDLLGFIKV